MNIQQLIKLASSAYPDSMVEQCFDPEKKEAVDAGDGLAKFIVQELIDTFDCGMGKTRTQLAEAARAIQVATRELSSVAQRLDRLANIAANTPRDKLPVLAVSKDEDERTLAEILLKEV
jgi:hypothetical protein